MSLLKGLQEIQLGDILETKTVPILLDTRKRSKNVYKLFSILKQLLSVIKIIKEELISSLLDKYVLCS